MVSKKISITLLGLVVVLLALSPFTPSPITFNVMNYGAHADGVTDDSGPILAAIAAANKVGGTVYLPAGTYRVLPTGTRDSGSGASLNRLAIPAGTRIAGASISTSHILGKLNVGANCRFSDIWLGVDLGSTYIATDGSTFDHVRFSGGGKYTAGQDWQSTWPWVDCSVVAIFGSNLAFTDCIFDGVQYSDPTHVRKFNNVSTFGGSNIIYTRCHFEPAAYFHVEMWSGAGDGLFVHNDFFDCSFDTSVAAHIDYAMYGVSDSTVDNCTFASSGVGPNAHDPGDVTIEGGPLAHNITVSNCRMVRGKWCNISIQGQAHSCTITGNAIDGRTGTVGPYDRGDPPIYAYSSAGPTNDISITGNTIWSLPTVEGLCPAIKVVGNGNDVSRNFIHGWRNTRGTGDNAGTVRVVGRSNTVSGNTVD